MKTLARALWNEPAVFISAVVAALTVTAAVLPLDGTARAIVVALLALAGGQQTRARVTPARRTAATNVVVRVSPPDPTEIQQALIREFRER